MGKLPFSVLMITLNEEANLPGALESIKDIVQDVFIVDSCSTDQTVNIAFEYGANIVQRPFTNFGDHWNWVIENMPVATPWTFLLAPDERFSSSLVGELKELLSKDPPCSGYTVRWRLWFMGKPLHVVSDMLRFWRTGKCHISDVKVNERPIVDGPVGKLKGILEHHDSSNLHYWFDKQNRYSTMEAIMMVKGDSLSATPRLLGSTLERRMFFKKIFFKVPFRYQIQWLHEVFGRGAWRDGRVGFTWGRLRVEARRMRELKAREMRMTGVIPELPIPQRGDFDPRILDSPLQKKLASRIHQSALGSSGSLK